MLKANFPRKFNTSTYNVARGTCFHTHTDPITDSIYYRSCPELLPKHGELMPPYQESSGIETEALVFREK